MTVRRVLVALGSPVLMAQRYADIGENPNALTFTSFLGCTQVPHLTPVPSPSVTRHSNHVGQRMRR